MPPLSKVMPLPTRTSGLCFFGAAEVLEHDELRRLVAAVRHRQERSHLQFFELRPVEHLAFEAEFLRQRLRALGQVGGRADVARQVAQIARQVHAVRDREPARRGGLAGGQVAALRHRKRELAQWPAHIGRLAFHLVEAVDGLHRDDNRVLDPPGDFTALDLFLGQVDDCLVRPGFVKQAYCGADGAAEFALAEVALFAQADQQDAVGQRPAHVV